MSECITKTEEKSAELHKLSWMNDKDKRQKPIITRKENGSCKPTPPIYQAILRKPIIYSPKSIYIAEFNDQSTISNGSDIHKSLCTLLPIHTLTFLF